MYELSAPEAAKKAKRRRAEARTMHAHLWRGRPGHWYCRRCGYRRRGDELDDAPCQVGVEYGRLDFTGGRDE